MAQMRLDKLLTHLNCGSRKEVQALIRAGRVSVEGWSAIRRQARSGDCGGFCGRAGAALPAQRYYMLNKPAGVITASQDARHPTVLGLFSGERAAWLVCGRTAG